MSVVETHKLPTLEHLHLKGEHIYIYISLILKKIKNQNQTCLAEIKPRNTTNTPPQTKKSIENSISHFPFRNLATKYDLFCYSGWYSAEKPSFLSLLDPICGKTVGHG